MPWRFRADAARRPQVPQGSRLQDSGASEPVRVKAGKLENHYPHALTVKYKGSQH